MTYMFNNHDISLYVKAHPAHCARFKFMDELFWRVMELVWKSLSYGRRQFLFLSSENDFDGNPFEDRPSVPHLSPYLFTIIYLCRKMAKVSFYLVQKLGLAFLVHWCNSLLTCKYILYFSCFFFKIIVVVWVFIFLCRLGKITLLYYLLFVAGTKCSIYIRWQCILVLRL